MYIGGKPLTVIIDGSETVLFNNIDDFNSFSEEVQELEKKANIAINSNNWGDIYSALTGLVTERTYAVTIMPDAIKLITNNAITGSCKGVVCRISDNAYDFMVMVGNSEAKLFRVSNITTTGTGTMSTIRNVTTTAQS